MNVTENKDRARRLYVAVFGEGNLAVADEILAADHVGHGPGAPQTVGRDQIKRQSMLLRTAIPDLKVNLEDQVAESDRVSCRWSASGTFSGELRLPTGIISPTGASIGFTEMRIDRFRDGWSVESWFIPDRFTLWQQLGLIGGQPR